MLDLTAVPCADYPAGVVPVTRATAEDVAQAYDPKTNDTGLAAAAVRAVEGSEGMPMSVQLVAMPWREELCLRAMMEVQAGAGFELDSWAALRPEPRETHEMAGIPQAKL